MPETMNGLEAYVEHVLQCEDSAEGIFTAVYEVYARKYQLNNTRIAIGAEEQNTLFAQYETIETDTEKACKVMRTIRRHAGEEVFRQLCMIAASADIEKGQAVFKTVEQIVRYPREAHSVMDRISEPYIHKAFTLYRNVRNETHSIREFLRFRESEKGILFSEIGPKNNILAFIMPHFADRFPRENFMIYDENHCILAMHPAGEEWYLMHGININQEDREKALVYGNDMSKDFFAVSEKEEKYRELFKHFCHKIAIKERENLELQRNHLPLKYREYMTEFAK